MARTGRPGLWHEQRAELWQRWKAGETLSDIGRALGKHAASVFGVVAAKDGFAPAPRSRKPGSLSVAEREEISRGLAEGRDLCQIGRDLGRAASPISREFARNGGCRMYRAARAEERALDCALRPRPCRLVFNHALCRLVAEKLSGQWSPQQIAGWLKARGHPGDPSMTIPHETIYKSLFIQARGVLKKELLVHLPRRPDRASGPNRDNGRSDPGADRRRRVDLWQTSRSRGSRHPRSLGRRAVKRCQKQPYRHAGRTQLALCHAGQSRRQGQRQCCPRPDLPGAAPAAWIR